MTTSSNPRATCKRTSSGFTLVLFIPPVPASRPRVTRWGTYYLKTYKAYKDAATKAIRASTRPPLVGNLSAIIEFVCNKPKTTKLTTPRGDIDNHCKAILDAVVGEKETPKGFINDDDQISKLVAYKRYARPGEEPHTRITIELETDPRG